MFPCCPSRATPCCSSRTTPGCSSRTIPRLLEYHGPGQSGFLKKLPAPRPVSDLRDVPSDPRARDPSSSLFSSPQAGPCRATAIPFQQPYGCIRAKGCWHCCPGEDRSPLRPKGAPDPEGPAHRAFSEHPTSLTHKGQPASLHHRLCLAMLDAPSHPMEGTMPFPRGCA